MTQRSFDCLLVSDFNLNSFSGYLKNLPEQPSVKPFQGDYGQVLPSLFDISAAPWPDKPDVVLVWTRPEAVIESFQAVLELRSFEIENVLQEVRTFASALIRAADTVSSIFIPAWNVPTWNRGWGVLDNREFGISSILDRMNTTLCECLKEHSNVYILNSRKWIESAGVSAFDPKYWYLAKVPFGNAVFKEAAADVKAALAGIAGLARKLVIVDLDDTLWGGIIGDLGWQNLRLGGHDPVGEAFVDFQRALKALQRRGIILGIVSKNEESVALEAIRQHPEMVLRLEDFAGWRINWDDKARNVVELVKELNLGLDSTVFIDDNPAERARVRESLPSILVPEWPVDKMSYVPSLLSMRCFDAPSVSEEDSQRVKAYASERQRTNLMGEMNSVEDWLDTLKLEVTVEELNVSNLKRCVQLLNKTNQMNLSTRRMTDNDFMVWASLSTHKCWCFHVSDRFGDAGLTGIVSVDCSANNVHIIDFVLSCRVFGRDIEKAMLHVAIDYAFKYGKPAIQAHYLATEKNKPCLDFWESKSGFESRNEQHVYQWHTDNNFAVPDFITLNWVKPAEPG